MIGKKQAVLLLGAWSAAAVSGWAQQAPATKTEQQVPTFPGGMEGLMQVVRANIQYPATALRDQVSGRVVVLFTVDTLGNATNVRVKEGVRADLDAEGARLAGLFNGWTPARLAGRKVPVEYTVPITFSISEVRADRVSDSLDRTRAVNRLTPIISGWPAGQGEVPADKGVVYGLFLQRLGFSSGGIGQYVNFYHLETGRSVSILVKPALKSRKDNAFCVALPPGHYALRGYQYNASGEAIRKPIWPQAGAPIEATRYVLTVVAGQLQYAGTWHFEQPGPPAFLAEKAATDARLREKFDKLPFETAVTRLPE